MPAKVETLRISAIKVDPAVQIRKGTNEEVLKRYEECFEVLPPVLVYRTPDGQVLADGFHRVAVALRLGHSEIRAEIREGSKEDALEAAVLANIAHGFPLTPEERDTGIRRLHLLHPDWQRQHIAKIMSLASSTVTHAIQVQEVRKHVVSRKLHRIPDFLVAEVAPAPREHWESLLNAADKRSWNREGIRQAVQNLADESLPGVLKHNILEGKADPVERMPDDTLQVPLRFIDKKAIKARKPVPPDPVGPDVAERLQPVTVTIGLSYYLPSDKTRKRGLKEYKRESELIERNYEIVINHEALDGFGDSHDPNSKGLVMLLRRINQELWKRLNSEGWPKQENMGESVRPGLAI